MEDHGDEEWVKDYGNMSGDHMNEKKDRSDREVVSHGNMSGDHVNENKDMSDCEVVSHDGMIQW